MAVTVTVTVAVVVVVVVVVARTLALALGGQRIRRRHVLQRVSMSRTVLGDD